MVIGIGVDMVSISEIKKFETEFGNHFFTRTFTKNENKLAEARPDIRRAEFYAGRFACKEAVFKAIAHHTKEKTWDFRCVETLIYEDGAPYLNMNEELQKYMDEAGAKTIHLSISNEEEYVIAFAVAEG